MGLEAITYTSGTWLFAGDATGQVIDSCHRMRVVGIWLAVKGRRVEPVTAALWL